MEPMLPAEGKREHEDLAVDLVSKASSLVGQIHSIVARRVSALVHTTNCYYSNLNYPGLRKLT